MISITSAMAALLLCMSFILIMLHGEMLCIAVSSGQDAKLHVVYMGNTLTQQNGHSQSAAVATHLNMLESVHASRDAAQESLKYSYGKSFGGFAAMLSPSHAQQLKKMDGVVSVFESKQLQLFTTRSWDFIGLTASAQNKDLPYQNDIIIGVIDTGIWPDSDSFNDTGFGPVPSKWKGGCNTSSDFPSCNRKLVGAKFYRSSTSEIPYGEFMSPRDGVGHGTHTSSTAAGNHVNTAGLYGIAPGDARGGVPGARVAMYKVCWIDSCFEADVLAAFDDAISDNVDIISLSLGTGNRRANYFENVNSIGAFHAMEKGILVSNAAGNFGPSRASVTNYSPWSLTVASSTLDRKFISELLLGNNISTRGMAVNTYTMNQTWYPLVYGGDVPNSDAGYTSSQSSQCLINSLDRTKVKGKIVLCYYNTDPPDYAVFQAYGVGVIIILDVSDTAYLWLNPATVITSKQGDAVLSYIRSTSTPVAKIEKTTLAKAVAPIVAFTSSRGYNPITMGILKPDITAPGVNIIAAWAKETAISDKLGDPRRSAFNILSGTSMACPHASGAAGFVKSYHKDWSPAAIKSALMTTAFVMDPTLAGNEDAEFAYGAGQINPVKAINPGLVYDIGVQDYVNFLCKSGYNDTTLRLVTGDSSSCKNIVPSGSGAGELNYPSIMVLLVGGKSFKSTFLRTVTNVGVVPSTYKATISAPTGTNVSVEPDTLSFSSLHQKLSYNVTIEGGAIANSTLLSGSLTWSYADYAARIPINLLYLEIS